MSIATEIRTSVEIPASFRHVTDKEATRWAMGCVKVTPATPDSRTTDENGHTTGSEGTCLIEATDSHILAIREVSGTSADVQLVPQAVLPTAKNKTRVTLNGQWENAQGKYCRDEAQGRFPRTADVMPQLIPGDAAVTVVRINAELLASLQSAIHDSADYAGVTLFIRGNEDVIAVLGDSGIGAIMPLAIDRDSASDVAKYEERRKRHAELTAGK